MRVTDLCFPYPVLGMPGAILGDEPEVNFSCYIPEDRNLIQIPYKWVFDFDLKNSDIQELVKAGKAQYMCEVTCSATLLRRCFFSSDSKLTVELDRRSVNKRVDFALFVVAVEHIEKYDNALANEDYRELAPFDLVVGSPLAILNSYHWDADLCYEDLTSLRSILQVLRNNSDPNQEFVTLNLEHEYIQIYLPPQQYDAFMAKSQSGPFSEVIKSSVILYAIQAALSQISAEKNHRWERALETYVRQDDKFANLSLDNPGDHPAIAVRLLGNPFKGLADVFPKLAVAGMDSAGDDDNDDVEASE